MIYIKYLREINGVTGHHRKTAGKSSDSPSGSLMNIGAGYKNFARISDAGMLSRRVWD